MSLRSPAKAIFAAVCAAALVGCASSGGDSSSGMQNEGRQVFGDVGAAPDSLLVQRDLILDEAVRIAKSRPDAPAARGAARERRQQARRGPRTTRRQREQQDS